MFTDELIKKRKSYLKSKDKLDNLETLNLDTFYSDNDIQHKWMRLEESVRECKEFCISNEHSQNLNNQHDKLEVQGLKVDLRYEKRIDTNHRKKIGGLLIQRMWRGYRGRCYAIFVRQTYAAIVIQKYARRFLARKIAHNLRIQRSCLKIQV